MAAELTQNLHRRHPGQQVLRTVLLHEQSGGLFFVPASLALPAGMFHIGPIELSANDLASAYARAGLTTFPKSRPNWAVLARLHYRPI